MAESLKDLAKELIYNYASPAPYLTRNGWEPVAEYGVSRPTLANVARGYYGGMLNNMFNNVDDQRLRDILNNAMVMNREHQRLNAMQYGGYPLYPED